VIDDFSAPADLQPITTRSTLGGRVRSAAWSAAELGRLSDRLAERGGAALAGLSVEHRVEVWLASVAALLDPQSEERRELMPSLVDTSRLSPEGLSEALDVVVGGAGPTAAKELSARANRREVEGPAAVVLAANVPGLAVQTLLPALLLGRPLLLRSSSREPLFAAALVRALVRREPLLADAIAAVAWMGGDTELESAALGVCRRVVAYGGQASITALRERLGDRLVAHGPRASVAIVTGAIDPLAVARRLARDVALLDQRGCLSIQAVYVVGEAAELADALAYALAAEHRLLPPGPIEPSIAARVQQLRGEAELRNALIGTLDLEQGSVIVDDVARFRPVPGLRTVRVHPVDRLGSALAALAPWRGSLQGVAVAGDDATRSAPRLTRTLGLARCAPAGRLQHADAGWASGGVDPIAALG
jgi:hypothetical protein